MSVSVCRIFCRGRGRAHAIDGVDKTQRWSWAFVVLYSRQNLIYSFVFLFDMKSRTTLSELHPLTTYASFLRIDISSRCNCSDPIHLHLQRCSCGDDWGTYGLGCKFRMDWRRKGDEFMIGQNSGPMRWPAKIALALCLTASPFYVGIPYFLLLQYVAKLTTT